jgi:SAM-dependent methyltransferase
MDDIKGSPDRFGYEWKKYCEILPIYQEQFDRWTSPLIKKSEWKEKVFIDVGCGIGRNSFWPLTYGASEALCIDVDDRTLECAKTNLKKFKSVDIVNRSAYQINESDRFDIAFSIGVIHHLEDPNLALRNMVESVKHGGSVLIWVYGYENNEWVVKYFNPLRKVLFSRLPISVVHFLSIFPTLFLYIYIRLIKGKTEYINLIRKFSFSHLRSIVFDQMLPKIANYYKEEEVENLMKSVGLVDIKTNWVNEMSWAVIGKKINL